MGAVPLAVELGARSVDHLEATGRAGVAQLASSDVVGVLLPASALFLGRPMPPARALVDAGAAIALATDFNPGSAYCESLPVVCALACTQLGLTPEEALVACTVNAAHVLGRDRNAVGSLPGYDADVVLLDAPDWRHLAYHLAGDVVHTVVQEGRSLPCGHNRGDGDPEAARQRRRRSGTTTTSSTIDGEGNETSTASESTAASPSASKRRREGAGPSGASRSGRRDGPAAVVAARPQARRDLRTDLPRDRDAAWRADASTLAGAVVQTIFLLLIFVPFSYVMDSARSGARTRSDGSRRSPHADDAERRRRPPGSGCGRGRRPAER